MRIEIFTFMRFVAAMIVVVFHYGKDTGLSAMSPGFLTSGPQMVTFFFVLSGFVMVISYYKKNEFSTRSYYYNRIARILPVYFIALIISSFLDLFKGHLDGTSLVLSSLFLQSWVPPHPLAINSPGWSLSVEAFFYAIFPAIIMSIRKRIITAKGAVMIGLGVWLLTQAILTYGLNSGIYKGFPSPSHDFIFYFPLVHVCSFLLGAGGAYFILQAEEGSRKLIILRNFILPVSLLTYLVLEYEDPIVLSYGYFLPTESSFLAPLFLLLIMSVAASKGAIMKVFSSKIPIILGEASYSIYILQEPLYRIYNNISPRLGLSADIHFYLFATILVIASIASFFFIEKPGKAYLTRMFSVPPSPVLANQGKTG